VGNGGSLSFIVAPNAVRSLDGAGDRCEVISTVPRVGLYEALNLVFRQLLPCPNAVPTTLADALHVAVGVVLLLFNSARTNRAQFRSLACVSALVDGGRLF
jgi:hypothetical protein